MPNMALWCCCADECPSQLELTVAGLDTIDCLGCYNHDFTSDPPGTSPIKIEWATLSGLDGVHLIDKTSESSTFCFYELWVPVNCTRLAYESGDCSDASVYTQDVYWGILRIRYRKSSDSIFLVQVELQTQSNPFDVPDYVTEPVTDDHGSTIQATQTYDKDNDPIAFGEVLTQADLVQTACSGSVWRTGGGSVEVNLP